MAKLKLKAYHWHWFEGYTVHITLKVLLQFFSKPIQKIVLL